MSESNNGSLGKVFIGISLAVFAFIFLDVILDLITPIPLSIQNFLRTVDRELGSIAGQLLDRLLGLSPSQIGIILAALLLLSLFYDSEEDDYLTDSDKAKYSENDGLTDAFWNLVRGLLRGVVHGSLVVFSIFVGLTNLAGSVLIGVGSWVKGLDISTKFDLGALLGLPGIKLVVNLFGGDDK